MLKLMTADFPFAELFARLSAACEGKDVFVSLPAKGLSVVPVKAVRSGLVPCGVPKPKADRSMVPEPTVALIVAGVALVDVVADKSLKSHAAKTPWACADISTESITLNTQTIAEVFMV